MEYVLYITICILYAIFFVMWFRYNRVIRKSKDCEAYVILERIGKLHFFYNKLKYTDSVILFFPLISLSLDNISVDSIVMLVVLIYLEGSSILRDYIENYLHHTIEQIERNNNEEEEAV